MFIGKKVLRNGNCFDRRANNTVPTEREFQSIPKRDIATKKPDKCPIGTGGTMFSTKNLTHDNPTL
jgi:hypothetical protein